MKTNFKLAALLIGSFLSFSTFAVDLPVVAPPEEFQSGEFAEGTMTEMSPQDVQRFLPWAENAQKTLADALKESKRLPLAEKVAFLENEIQTVVRGSGNKSYQMFMRYSLTRGLLLTKILKEESDIRDIGILENHLSILVSSIDLARKFYESDFSSQNNQSEEKFKAPAHVDFAREMGRTYLYHALSIFDISAQYRVYYKVLEMVNWDLAQDPRASDPKNAEIIVDIYKTLQRLPKKPHAEADLLPHIKTMNFLIEKLGPVFKPIENK